MGSEPELLRNPIFLQFSGGGTGPPVPPLDQYCIFAKTFSAIVSTGFRDLNFDWIPQLHTYIVYMGVEYFREYVHSQWLT